MGGGGDPQGQQPQSAQGGGGDWRQFAAKIMTSNPNLTPGALLYALHAAQPFMNADSRAQIQQLGLEMREKNIESRERIAGAATTERGREADQKAGIEEKKLTAKAEQFKTHQAAIQQRFEDRYMQAEEKIANAKTKEAKAAVLTELRQAEQDRRAAMANRVKAAAAGMDTKELKALEEEERQNKQDAEQRIDALTKQARGDAPARAALGGREAATQAAPKGKPLDDTVKRQMQEAIQAGASKEAIAAKARELGYDISGF
jgi:hypothetical protein